MFVSSHGLKKYIHYSPNNMAKRLVAKIGDVFCVELGNGTKGYFQYVANDLSDLNSHVICAFKTHYPIETEVKIDNIVNDEIDFYAHTVLHVGFRENKWYKVGNSRYINLEKISHLIFCNADEFDIKSDTFEIVDTNPLSNWFIWRISLEPTSVGKLPKNFVDKVEIGSVFPYSDIIDRMRRGYYSCSLDEYEIIKRKPRPEYVSYINIIEMT